MKVASISIWPILFSVLPVILTWRDALSAVLGQIVIFAMRVTISVEVYANYVLTQTVKTATPLIVSTVFQDISLAPMAAVRAVLLSIHQPASSVMILSAWAVKLDFICWVETALLVLMPTARFVTVPLPLSVLVAIQDILSMLEVFVSSATPQWQAAMNALLQLCAKPVIKDITFW